MSNNWSEFKLRINTTASVEKAFNAVATPGGLESWFLREAGVTAGGKHRAKGDMIQKGDEYHFQWHGHPREPQAFGQIPLDGWEKCDQLYLFPGFAGDDQYLSGV